MEPGAEAIAAHAVVVEGQAAAQSGQRRIEAAHLQRAAIEARRAGHMQRRFAVIQRNLQMQIDRGGAGGIGLAQQAVQLLAQRAVAQQLVVMRGVAVGAAVDGQARLAEIGNLRLDMIDRVAADLRAAGADLQAVAAEAQLRLQLFRLRPAG